MLAALCNDPDLLACAIHEVRGSLALKRESSHDGVGLGYYQADEPLLKKRPAEKAADRSAGDAGLDLAAMFDGVSSTAALLHVRRGTVGGWHEANTHPFRFRRWLFAHVGDIPRLEAARGELMAGLPPFLSRNLRGETDSELLFHLFLKVLFKAGTLNNQDMPVEQVAAYLAEALQLLDGLPGERAGPGTFALCVTHGQAMVAANRGVSLHYSHREGLHDCPKHPPSERNDPSHGRFKGILLGADMADPGHQWREVADGSLVTVSGTLELKVTHL
jgi:glutamine amidotransferase